jgi:hypothetical protein
MCLHDGKRTEAFKETAVLKDVDGKAILTSEHLTIVIEYDVFTTAVPYCSCS